MRHDDALGDVLVNVMSEFVRKYGFNLIVVADEPKIREAADELRKKGVDVESVEADLATGEGVDKLMQKISGRSVDALLANAGRGLANAFLDQDWKDIRFVIDTNVTGTVELIHRIVRNVVAAEDPRLRGIPGLRPCRRPGLSIG